jgi:hypothetical protein
MKLTALICSGLAASMFLSACGEGAKAATSNPLIAWCMETKTRETCECADAALRATSAENDYEIYKGMAPNYLERRAAGDGRVAAFDAASEEAAGRLGMTASELRTVTNRIGRQHRDAIKLKQCGG